ncbi:WxL protein peptidoglycan domain-containing protein [Lentzea sp. E54]|uniref:WxL protein peptidoglycan domain-containing protein n=1 Tax=Lentzea xerophila TaxID=3435883 RepID=UPI003DA26C58
MRRPLAALIVVLGLVSPTPATAQPVQDDARLTWSVAPADATGPNGRARFEYVVEPGMRYDDHIAVRNLGESELNVDLYAADAVNTSTGGFDLLARDEPSPSMGSWITITEPKVILKPRSTTVVPFRLTVPQDAEPGDHAGGLVAALTTGAQVQVERRVGARLYVRVAGPVTPNLRVDQPTAAYRGTVNPAAPGEADVTWTVVNDGNVRLAFRPSVRVEGLFGLGTTQWTSDTPTELLPGGAITLNHTLTGVWPLGPLTVSGEAEPVASGPQDLAGVVATATADTTLWAIPWSALGALLLLTAILVALWRVRRRIRRLTKAAGTAEQPATPN